MQKRTRRITHDVYYLAFNKTPVNSRAYTSPVLLTEIHFIIVRHDRGLHVISHYNATYTYPAI